jgi:broad specificity phosphatase PhoE
MQTRFTLIRHGQTSWNLNGRWQGHAAIPLDEVGHQQAQALAEYLKSWDVDRIYSSDLGRCVSTAKYIAQALEMDFAQDARLREIDVGDWQGLTQAEVEAWDSERFAQVMANPFNVKRPGGESFNDHSARVTPAIMDYLKNHAGEHLLIVTHGGSVHAIVRGLLRAEIPAERRQIPNTSLTDIVYDPTKNEWHLGLIGVTPHLDALEKFVMPTRVQNPDIPVLK